MMGEKAYRPVVAYVRLVTILVIMIDEAQLLRFTVPMPLGLVAEKVSSLTRNFSTSKEVHTLHRAVCFGGTGGYGK